MVHRAAPCGLLPASPLGLSMGIKNTFAQVGYDSDTSDRAQSALVRICAAGVSTFDIDEPSVEQRSAKQFNFTKPRHLAQYFDIYDETVEIAIQTEHTRDSLRHHMADGRCQACGAVVMFEVPTMTDKTMYDLRCLDQLTGTWVPLAQSNAHAIVEERKTVLNGCTKSSHSVCLGMRGSQLSIDMDCDGTLCFPHVVMEGGPDTARMLNEDFASIVALKSFYV